MTCPGSPATRAKDNLDWLQSLWSPLPWANGALRSWKWAGTGAIYREPGPREAQLAPGLSSVGGSQNLRFYWKEFVNEVDVLVFMVDSADRLRLPWARQELHKLLDKDPDLPVVVVANKQVRAIGGWLRPVGLDPLIPRQGQGAQDSD